MSFLIVSGILFAVLFGLAFLTKRRLGILGLALAAGSVISSLWVNDLTPLVAKAGFTLSQPPLESVVAAVLLVVPAAFLLIGGPVYKGSYGRVVGSLLFALLALFLMLDILESSLVIEGVGQTVFTMLRDWQMLGTSVILMLAIFDALSIRTPKPEKPAKH